MWIITMTQVFWLNAAQPDALPITVFEGENIVCLAAGAEMAAVVDGDTLILLRHDDVIKVAHGVAEPIRCALVLGATPTDVLLGTQEARLYRWREGDEQATRVEAFDALEVRADWNTPWGGPADVRSLAQSSDGWVYANIHVGSIVRSPDGGQTWEPVTPTLNRDVHEVATCPAAPARVYANTARGVYLSEDRGDSWLHRVQGLEALYGRAVAVHPQDPDLLLATTSRGPRGDAQGRLYRSIDAGETWTQVEGELPTPLEGNIDTFHVAITPDGRGWVVVDDGLYVGEQQPDAWTRFWQAPAPIRALAVAR